MTKQFSTSIVQRKGKGYKAILPFEFDEDAGEDKAVAIPSKIHLIPIGQWEHDLYGPIIINASDIREYLQNFNAGIRKGVYITAGHEGMLEQPAVGWITEVEARDSGLWGTVEWNELGMESLSDKQFKFFSPEMYRDYEDPQTHEFYRNVLTGGALTKSPYFKELEAIVFSDRNIKNNYSDKKSMTKTLEEVLALEVEALTEEDKAILKENEATLTDEQKAKYFPKTETEEEKATRLAEEEEKAKGDANEAAGLNRDGSPKEPKIEGSEKVMISASELAILRSKANEGQQAFKELQESKLTASVNALIFSQSNKSGIFLPKSMNTLRAFMEKLNDAQKVEFSTLLRDLPKSNLFSEIGSGGGSGDGSAEHEVEAKIQEKISASEKAGKIMKYSEALKEVMSENKGLEERYNSEISAKK